MTVRLMRAEAMETTGPEADRRREPRFAARIDARMKSSRGDVVDIHLAEVSLHGCRVVSAEPWLKNGMFVEIGLGDEPMLEAIIRWVRDGSVGMEFLWPIPPERREWHDLADMPF